MYGMLINIINLVRNQRNELVIQINVCRTNSSDFMCFFQSRMYSIIVSYACDVSVSAGRIHRFEVINQTAPKRASSRTEHRTYHDGPAFHHVNCMRTF